MPFFAGFDRERYPGIEMMNWLKENSNLKWCGYYLAPAPNRSRSGWPAQYDSLKNNWGVVPIYVGQQDPQTRRARCLLTTGQGTTDGENAAALAGADKFPSGTAIFLDWEKGDLDANGATAYIAAWLQAVAGDGRFMPGLYCSHLIAGRLAQLVGAVNLTPLARFWCWRVSTNTRHQFKGDLSAVPELDPVGCGFDGAEAWQRDQNAIVTLPVGAPLNSLSVDFSTSARPNPAAP